MHSGCCLLLLVLHSQADYFASMFNGPWKESESQRVEIDIVDENITEEGMY